MKIGIDLGGSHIAIGVVNKEGKIVEKIEKRILKNEKKKIKETIENYIIENVEKLQEKHKIESIGIAVPGTVTEKKIIKSVNLGIENYELVEQLENKLKTKISIKMRNDAKCAAIAEAKYGCLKDCKRSLFITLGTGIGGAVTINGKLLDTGELPGCEFGHMIIEKNGIQCNCGKKGCWEKYASMKALKTNLRNQLGIDEKTSGQELLNIIRNTKQEDENYEKIHNTIDEYIENLSIGISNLINIFEPEVIGIGGSFVYFEHILLKKLREQLKENNMIFNSQKETKIVTAIMQNDAGIIGAID